MSNQENQNTEEQLNLSETSTHDSDSSVQERIDTLLAELHQMSREDSPEAYADAQVKLSYLYNAQGQQDEAEAARQKAIEAYQEVPKNDRQAYAWARYKLGTLYGALGQQDEAKHIWRKVRRNDSSEAYAWAQLELGVLYDLLEQQDKAKSIWKKIHRGDCPEAYADACVMLGHLYDVQKQQDEAKNAWEEAIRTYQEILEDDSHHAWARYKLGNQHYFLEHIDQAKYIWKKVNRSDSPQAYAWAQVNLGVLYKAQGKQEKSKEVWEKVYRRDNRQAYARAQFSLGSIYQDYQNVKTLDAAITAYKNVHREDDLKAYARAQFNLGLVYHAQNKLDQAITTWSNIHHDDDSEAFAKAQFSLGEIYAQDKENVEKAEKAYLNARDFLYYKSERVLKIFTCPEGVREKLNTLTKNTDKLLISLQVIPDYESKVAHYSRVSTAFSLLDNKEPSQFRLSTIRGVNDPTEGLVLDTYWNKQGISENIHTNDTATFISCFTFNHDSLNQFRLYGKESEQEATGVSLVVKKDFFSSQLEVIANPSKKISNKTEKVGSNKLNKLENGSMKLPTDKSRLQTLYRCIYLDPESGYWTLAKRDKFTFYQTPEEFGESKEKWEKYYKLISKKEKCVKKYLFGEKDNKNKSISSILKSIFTEDHSYNKCNKYEKQKILEAIRFILLPLQYLVKHIAFQEEQECRIMYITQFRDKKIHSDREKQWMYVEYEEPVLPHIDKIWLSPGAAKYQDHFRILLDRNGKESKVRISQNPFRNKE